MGRPSKYQIIDLSSLRGRLQDIRRQGGLKQSDLAKLVGITRECYAVYENERVPLMFSTGWEICRRCGISQIWLALGKGRREGFLGLDIDFQAAGITDRTWFREGVQSLWPRLVEVARKNEVPEIEIPAYPPEVVRITEPGISFRAIRQTAKGRIALTPADIQAMRLSVPVEYRPGAKPPGGPEVLELVHPGFEAVVQFLMPQRPRNAAAELLRKCLSPELRTDEFLNLLDQRFALELMLAAMKLTGVDPT